MKKLTLLLFSLFLVLSGHVNIIFAQPSGIYCRFQFQGQVHYGKVENATIKILDKAPWEGGRETDKIVSLSQVTLLYPSEPRVIIGLSKSYKNAWKRKQAPKTVRWFIKPPGAAASPGEDIVLPPVLDQVKVEAEMVIVIGKKIKNADEKEARAAIFGYTLGDDIVGTVESYHRLTGEPPNFPEKVLATGLKICDRFAPFGPFIYRGINWKNLIRTLDIINPQTHKKIHFEDNTSNLIYTPAKIVSDLSRVLTLFPGDIIFTGTSKSFIATPGDIVTISANGLGKIQNKIVVPMNNLGKEGSK